MPISANVSRGYPGFLTRIMRTFVWRIQFGSPQGAHLQRKGPKVRIWSSGSSTGQEPYSIAMLVREYANANAHRGISAEDFGILATDISAAVLGQAMAGVPTDYLRLRRTHIRSPRQPTPNRASVDGSGTGLAFHSTTKATGPAQNSSASSQSSSNPEMGAGPE